MIRGRIRRLLSSRRGLLFAGLLVVALAIGGLTAIRIHDVHDPVAWEPVDTSAEPQTVVHDVNRQLERVDHRRVTRVWRVDGDGPRHLRGVYEDAYDYSDRQWVANYYGPQPADRAVSATIGLHDRIVTGPRNRTLVYLEDRTVARAWWDGNETLDPGTYDVPPGARTETRTDLLEYEDAYLGGFFVPGHDAEWQVVDRGDGTITLGVDGVAQYFRARSLPPGFEIHEGSRIRLRLDAESGRPIEVSERRVLTTEVVVERADGEDVDVERTYTVDLETTFGDWESLDVSRPDGIRFDPPTLHDFVQDFLSY